MDRHTKEQRSYNMSRVKSKNTGPEKILFARLKNKGYKFHKHYNLPGKPDVAFSNYKVVVFIDGEFWHGKDFNEWKDKLTVFWYEKIMGNIKRDRKNNKLLRIKGWHIIHMWGKEIIMNPDKSVEKLIRFIQKNRNNG
jgi:DNA mismatch endonuclease, patch repair protein